MALRRKTRGTTRTRLTIRVDFDEFRLGPGKVRLLELIGESGSISAAGRGMDMSYRRAWLLIDEMNRHFREPVVLTMRGGRQGGGAELTEFGREVITRYRDLEARATTAAAPHVAAFDAKLVRR
jgi:molybdate transport system regulatory protein